MSQDNQFQQYGYDQYLKAPKKQRLGEGSSMWNGITDKLRSPVVATLALLATGALFTGVIIMAYPSGKGDQAEIPIIKADLSPIKSEPVEPGGMEVPYSDSTVLSSIGQEQPAEDINKIENLLTQANEDLGGKEEALQRAMGEDSAQAEEERLPQERGMFLQEEAQGWQAQQADIIPESNQASLEVAAPDSSGILQKIDPSQAQAISAESGGKLAETAAAEKPKMHAAATSPETIDFVRSALKEGKGEAKPEQIATSEDEESGVAPEEISAPQAPEFPEAAVEQYETPAQEIEPAAGVASSAINIERGDYYVQLASITDNSRAASEFGKLQKRFSVLDGLKYRVQEANLDKGTFYRIQAGPFSKDSAKSICEAIKAQKPGGCILVK